MTLNFPTDGYGIYEAVVTLSNASIYQPRLAQIAAGGFKLVMNYNVINGHATDMIAYINYAASIGLKVIVGIQDPRIWRDGTYSAYTQMYADAGSPGTGIAFMQYIVGQVKTLPGVWGYYIGDEPVNTDHATFAAYAAAVKVADSTHPRLIIASGSAANSVASGTNLFFDSCDVLGDDYYPIGGVSSYTRTTAQQATAVQSFINTQPGLQAAMALQAYSRSAYAPFPLVQNAPWPTATQMEQARSDALSNLHPRLLLWYSYFDVVQSGSPDFAPPAQWMQVVSAIQGKSDLALFPPAVRRGSLASNYNATANALTPVGRYRLGDAASSTIAQDSSGNGYDGTLNGGITSGVAGAITGDNDTAMTFNGTSGYISLPSDLNPATWGTISLECWFKLANITFVVTPTLIANSSFATNAGIQMFLSASGAALRLNVGNGASEGQMVFAHQFVAGTWYHVVGTWDGSTITMYLHSPIDTLTQTLSFSGSSLGSVASTFTIGRNPPPGGNFFPGTLDEVNIYHAVLSSSQVSALYAAGAVAVRSTTTLFPTAVRRQT